METVCRSGADVLLISAGQVHIVGWHFWESINPRWFRQINVGEQKSDSSKGILCVVLDAVKR